MIVVDHQKVDQVLDEIVEKVKLNRGGIGIGFVLDVEKVAGINQEG
ncbi:MAG: hypothetical protein PHO63_00640 [Bacilli bacterium]|nr:hypothetical protein [Bacilli bacterium]MDD4809458.1 hypothetical protein [Bacilli bacterium]